MIKVFIENEAGSDQKHLYNEKTLVFNKAITVSRKYPHPYGFILNTTSGDGDNLDCFILTEQKLQRLSSIKRISKIYFSFQTKKSPKKKY